MPKCFANSVRDYRNGTFWGNDLDDPYVMTTRSGLAIRAVPVSGSGSRTNNVSSNVKFSSGVPSPESYKVKKVVKYKSWNCLSFVTRYNLILCGTALDVSGSQRDLDDWLESLPFVYSRDDVQDVDLSSDGHTLSLSGTCTVPCSPRTSLYPPPHLKLVTSTTQVEKPRSKQDKTLLLSQFPKINANTQIIQLRSIGPEEVEAAVSAAATLVSMATTSANQQPSTSSVSGMHSADTEKDDNVSVSSSNKTLDSDYSEGQEDDVDGIDHSDLESFQQYSHEYTVDANGNRIHRCKVCHKVFTIYAAFKSHVRSHLKQKNRCPVCNKSFSRSWLLKGHMRTHTGERPYNCRHPGCDKAFADKSNLRSHMLIHTVTGKNFVCSKCKRAFAQKRYLHKHRLEVCRC